MIHESQTVMLKQRALKPVDIVVGLQLMLIPGATFKNLAASIGLSTGEAFNSVRRLGESKLLQPTERRPVQEILVRFLIAGVPYSFPPVFGPTVRGIPTALSGPLLRDRVESSEPMVWAHPDGDVRGRELVPLYRGASELPAKNSALYGLLTLVDALRVGQSRERQLAEEVLRERLTPGSA